MFITAQGCRLRNDLYCVEWDVKLYTIRSLQWRHETEETKPQTIPVVVALSKRDAVPESRPFCRKVAIFYTGLELVVRLQPHGY